MNKISSLKNKVKSIGKKISLILMYAALFLSNTMLVYANDITDSPIFKGIKKMFEDASGALLIIAPIVGAVLFGYFSIRKGAADEMDHKMWDKRKNIVIISTVSVFIASALISLITGYFPS